MVRNYTLIDDLIKKYRQAPYASKPKEAEPISNTFEISEAVENQPEEEIKSFVKSIHETIKLPADLKKLGLQPASSTSFPTYQNIKLPIADEKIIPGLHAPISSSRRWLATLAVYILKKAHLAIKIIGGKTVRVVKN